MKKLLFLGITLFTLCACNQDDMNDPSGPPKAADHILPLYGWMTLDNAAPETRGVAVSSKIWTRPIAENHLTVKFLNGSERYRQFVKEVAREWENYANVRFQFVPDDQNALIRIGFDYVRGMSSSWALTGTDHLQKYETQDEATVHFARWNRGSDASKRSDVLRAFGQVLGLELEFRHPSFYPAWITDEDGNIDEATIREYWENELNELISWEELKKVVLDPISVPAFLLEKTGYYDQNSVMSWPFYEMIARNIPVVEFDEDYKTELSEQDKKFIEKLYGEPTKFLRDPYFELLTFDYTGSKAQILITTTKDLIIFWDAGKDEILKTEASYIRIPADVMPPYTVTVKHEYAENKTYKIAVAELLDYGQEIPTESYALTSFDLISGVGMENLDTRPNFNKALSRVRVRGGENFKAQQFNFVGNDYLKELYLTEIGDSKVTIDNCPNLEVFATTDYIWELNLDDLGIAPPAEDEALGISSLTLEEHPIEDFILDQPLFEIFTRDTTSTFPWTPPKDTLIVRPPHKFIQPWPGDPQQNYSFTEDNGKGLTILNCPKLKKLSLDNTRMNTFSFKNLPNLEYVYLSSTSEHIVGSGTPAGNNLRTALSTLNSRKSKSPGQIIVRGIKYNTLYANPSYGYSAVTFDKYYINLLVTNQNWVICWDPKFEFKVAID